MTSLAQVGDVGRRFIAVDGHEASLFHGWSPRLKDYSPLGVRNCRWGMPGTIYDRECGGRSPCRRHTASPAARRQTRGQATTRSAAGSTNSQTRKLPKPTVYRLGDRAARIG